MDQQPTVDEKRLFVLKHLQRDLLVFQANGVTPDLRNVALWLELIGAVLGPDESNDPNGSSGQGIRRS